MGGSVSASSSDAPGWALFLIVMGMLVFIALIVAIVFAMLGIACFVTGASATAGVSAKDTWSAEVGEMEIEMGDMNIHGETAGSSAVTGTVALSVDASVEEDFGE